MSDQSGQSSPFRRIPPPINALPNTQTLDALPMPAPFFLVRTPTSPTPIRIAAVTFHADPTRQTHVPVTIPTQIPFPSPLSLGQDARAHPYAVAASRSFRQRGQFAGYVDRKEHADGLYPLVHDRNFGSDTADTQDELIDIVGDGDVLCSTAQATVSRNPTTSDEKKDGLDELQQADAQGSVMKSNENLMEELTLVENARFSTGKKMNFRSYVIQLKREIRMQSQPDSELEVDPDCKLKIPPEYYSWTDARRKAFDLYGIDSNTYYYHHLEPGEIQMTSKWTREEKDNFFKLLKDKKFFPRRGWGFFSRHIPGRIGSQCKSLYQALLKGGKIPDAIKVSFRRKESVDMNEADDSDSEGYKQTADLKLSFPGGQVIDYPRDTLRNVTNNKAIPYAYALLQGADFEHYMRKLCIILGRKTLSHSHIDVHLSNDVISSSFSIQISCSQFSIINRKFKQQYSNNINQEF